MDSLPPSLTHLIFGDNFAQVANCLPRSITLLSFEESYSLLLSSLPSYLTLLKIKSLEQVRTVQEEWRTVEIYNSAVT